MTDRDQSLSRSVSDRNSRRDSDVVQGGQLPPLGANSSTGLRAARIDQELHRGVHPQRLVQLNERARNGAAYDPPISTLTMDTDSLMECSIAGQDGPPPAPSPRRSVSFNSAQSFRRIPRPLRSLYARDGESSASAAPSTQPTVASKNASIKHDFLRLWHSEIRLDQSAPPVTPRMPSRTNSDNLSFASIAPSHVSSVSMASLWSYTSTGAVFRAQEIGVGRVLAQFPRQDLLRVEDICIAPQFDEEEAKRVRFREDTVGVGPTIMQIDLLALEAAQLSTNNRAEANPLASADVHFDIVIFAEEKLFYSRNVLKDKELVCLSEWLAGAMDGEELRGLGEGLQAEFDAIASDFGRLREVRAFGEHKDMYNATENKLRFLYIAVEQRMKAVAEAIVSVTMQLAEAELYTEPRLLSRKSPSAITEYVVEGTSSDDETASVRSEEEDYGQTETRKRWPITTRSMRMRRHTSKNDGHGTDLAQPEYVNRDYVGRSKPLNNKKAEVGSSVANIISAFEPDPSLFARTCSEDG